MDSAQEKEFSWKLTRIVSICFMIGYLFVFFITLPFETARFWINLIFPWLMMGFVAASRGKIRLKLDKSKGSLLGGFTFALPGVALFAPLMVSFSVLKWTPLILWSAPLTVLATLTAAKVDPRLRAFELPS